MMSAVPSVEALSTTMTSWPTLAGWRRRLDRHDRMYCAD